MAATQLFINTAASDISQALVRSVTDMTPVGFPSLVIGDGRDYELYLVDGLGGYASFSGDASFIPYLAIGSCGYPTGGTAVWTFNGYSTAALAWNVSPADLQIALLALTSIGAGNCAVAGVAGKYYVVTFTGSLGGSTQPEITVDFSELTPESTVDISTIVPGSASPATNCVQLANLAINPITFADDWTPITNGWTGKLSSRTLEIIEAFAAAGATLAETFQVTLADADGNRTTYAKVDVSIQCTIINPESFAGADKPLLATQAALDAAVLGLGNFSFESLSSTEVGNTNVTRPAAASRHHTARVAVSGAAALRTISLLTTNSPNTGDTILLAVLPDTTPGNEVKIYNASTGGTLLADFTTTAAGKPFLLVFTWNGSAWLLDFDQSLLLLAADNLAGLGNTLSAKQNLRSLFANINNQSAGNFVIGVGDEGSLFRVSGAAVATLPDPGTAGVGFLVGLQKFDGSATVVTTSPATLTLSTPGETAILQSDGSTWNILIVYNPVTGQPTIQQVVLNWYFITALTGDTATTLDGQPTAAGAMPANASVLLALGSPLVGQIWQLVAGTDAASSTVVRPADFDATTNPQVWKLILERTGNGFEAQTLTTGDITITPSGALFTEIVTVAGTARTSKIAIADANAVLGDNCQIRLNMPATASIVIEIHDGTTGGTLLYTYTTDGSGTDNGYFKLYFDGTAWKPLMQAVPVV